MRDTATNVQTPKRQGGPLDAPSSKEARTPRDTDDLPGQVPTNQSGIPPWHGRALFLEVAQDDLARATRHPLLGWPDFIRLFGDTGGVRLTRPISDAAQYCELAFDRPFTPQAGTDPVSIAFAKAGAVLTD